LENGNLLLITTHALLEDKVKFQNLGLAVIDEQHRFELSSVLNMEEKCDSTRFSNDCHSYPADTRNEFV
jgi:ATP-dependent DNA helicase RecG